MPITFERVWAVGRFDVRPSFSSYHKNHELEQSPTGGVWTQSGVRQSATSRRGGKSYQKGRGLPIHVETARCTHAYACLKRVRARTPLSITRSPALHSRKQKALWMVGRCPGIWTSPWTKRSVPLCVYVFGGWAPLCQIL